MTRGEWTFGACPVALDVGDRVTLGHGSGGILSQRLFEGLILPHFQNPILSRRDDQAIFELEGVRLAFTTDSFVVTPLFFPGGDIGRLAVNGTVNDLAMGGARPLYLSASLILEEGLPLSTLQAVLASMRDAAHACGVAIVTGDTKVVTRGSADGLFVTTSGVGVVPRERLLSADRARPGDAVLVSGTLAEHGMAVLSAREELGLGEALQSDTAPLAGLTETLLGSGAEVHCLRDPTRGGLAASLTEIAARSRIGVEIDESRLPLREPVQAACEILGIDPLHVASEGRLLAFVAPEGAELALEAARAHPLGKDAAIVGHALAEPVGTLVVRTVVGGRRVVQLPFTDPLPRIC
jgi:hydrogenase expression/formation protein HypE